ncbi:MAG: hypothetical protein IT166_11590 [Bryobacterales bacterium]|nr:hypothetical protein [Bryobacterales bacterium]
MNHIFRSASSVLLSISVVLICFSRREAAAQQPVSTVKTPPVAALQKNSPSAHPVTAPKPQGLSVDGIIAMAQAGISEEVIVARVRKENRAFDLSPEDMVMLKKAGVGDNVLRVMMDPKAEQPSLPVAAVPVSPTAPGSNHSSAKAVKTPDGEKVRLILMEDISSATANQGDRVNFTVAEDMKVGDTIIIAKGSTGAGTITEARRKGMLGRGGKLTMSIDQVKAVDGQNIRLRATAGREGDDKTGKTVAVAVLAGPFALLVKGKDIAAAKGTEYAAYIDETKDIVIK